VTHSGTARRRSIYVSEMAQHMTSDTVKSWGLDDVSPRCEMIFRWISSGMQKVTDWPFPSLRIRIQAKEIVNVLFGT
jgi:hypothetical protein